MSIRVFLIGLLYIFIVYEATCRQTAFQLLNITNPPPFYSWIYPKQLTFAGDSTKTNEQRKTNCSIDTLSFSKRILCQTSNTLSKINNAPVIDYTKQLAVSMFYKTTSLLSNNRNIDSLSLNNKTRIDSTQFTGKAINADSIVKKDTPFFIAKSLTNRYSMSICHGDSVMFANTYIKTSGTYCDSLLCIDGTDSIVILSLSVLESHRINKERTICYKDSIWLSGANRNVAGIYSDTLTNSVGCDSIITTRLTITNAFHSHSTKNICANDSIFFGDRYISKNGTYSDTLSSKCGCDSILKLTIHSKPHTERDTLVYLCPDSTYFAGGKNQNEEGTFVDTLLSQFGCDSIINTKLVKAKGYEHTFSHFICMGDSVEINGGYISEDYNYKVIYKNTYGCDSTISYNVQSLISYEIEEDSVICKKDTVFLEGAHRNKSGIYYDTLLTEMGCDSVIITNLIVHPAKESFFVKNICKGETYNFNNQKLSASGMYYDTLPTTFGCDSIVALSLHVFANGNTENDSVSICNGEFFTAGGIMQATDGRYFDTIKLTNKCKGILITDLSIKPTFSTNAYYALCEGERAYLHGDYRYESGVYFDTLKALNGCDSTVISTLEILLPSLERNRISICEDDTYYAEGKLQFESGTYADTLKSIAECDSIVITELTVLEKSDTSIYRSTCQGNSILFGNHTITESGTYWDTLPNMNGCDSIITLHAIVGETYLTSIDVTLCKNDSYYFNGTILTKDGIYLDTLSSQFGCDSIIYLDATYTETYNKYDTAYICKGETAFLQGAEQQEMGTYSDTIEGGEHCDTIITTQLLINNAIKITQHRGICRGDSVLAGNAFRKNQGTYFDTIRNDNGCDTIIETIIIKHETPLTINNIAICREDSFNIGNSSYSDEGIYTDTLTSEFGCDSIVKTRLTFREQKHSEKDTVICKGDTIFINNIPITKSGKYIEHRQSAYNCDSLITISLTVNNYIDNNKIVMACYGDTLYLQNRNITEVGIYYDTISNENTCDTVNIYNFILKNSFEEIVEATICNGDSILLENIYQKESGTYFDTIHADNACDTIKITELLVADDYMKYDTINICSADTAYIGGKPFMRNDTILQNLQSAFGCDSIIHTVLNVWENSHISIDTSIYKGDSLLFIDRYIYKERYYIDTIKNSHNCDSIITINLRVINNSAPRIINIDSQTVSYIKPCFSFNLNEFVEDDHVTNSQLQWSIKHSEHFTLAISEENIATVSLNDKKWKGSEIVSFTVTDDGGKQNTLKLIIRSTGTETHIAFTNETSLIVSPLPEKKKFHIEIFSSTQIKATISLLNKNGELLLSKTVSVLKSINSTDLKIKEFETGIYFLKVETENTSSTHEIIMETN